MKPKSSKDLSEDEFNAQLRAERAPKARGMVMTKPPTGPNKSLDEMLKEHQDELQPPQNTEVIEPPQEIKSPIVSKPGSIERTLRQIPVALIDPNPLAPREVYTPQMIKDRAEALRTQGQHDPIHVIPNPGHEGRFIICDGWTRVQACLEHKVLDELLAEIHEDLTIEESAWFGYQQNEERQQQCDLDRALFFEKLIGAGESATEIAKRARISKTQMTFFRAFAKLPADVMDIVKTTPDRFGASSAYQISKVADRVGVRQAVRLAVKFAEERHPYTWLVNQAQLLVNPSEHKTPPPSKQVRFGNGFYKQRGDFFEVSIEVSADKRADFAHALEALLSTVAVEPKSATQTSFSESTGDEDDA